MRSHSFKLHSVDILKYKNIALNDCTSNYSYSAYGFGISSAIPLPELAYSNLKVEVYLAIENDFHVPLYARGDRCFYKIAPDEAVLFDKDIGLFFIRNGKEIIINPAPTVSIRTIQLFIVGVVLNFLLHQKGYLVLHASSVGVDKNGIMFLGPKGCGKSTIAAAFYLVGSCVIADDVTAVKYSDDSASLPYGYPQVKVTENTASFLGCNVEKLVSLCPSIPKLGLRTDDLRYNADTPLKQVYLLKKGLSFGVKAVKPGDAFRELLKNSIFAGGSSHFFQCADLIGKVPFFYVYHPYSSDKLFRLVEDIKAHFYLGNDAV